MKSLFLSEAQISLFNVLEKPTIYVDNLEKERKIGFSHHFDLRDKMEQAFDYYLELEKKQVMDPIDKKLFDLVDRRFKIYKKHFHDVREMLNSENSVQ